MAMQTITRHLAFCVSLPSLSFNQLVSFSKSVKMCLFPYLNPLGDLRGLHTNLSFSEIRDMWSLYCFIWILSLFEGRTNHEFILFPVKFTAHHLFSLSSRLWIEFLGFGRWIIQGLESSVAIQKAVLVANSMQFTFSPWWFPPKNSSRRDTQKRSGGWDSVPQQTLFV